MAPYQRPAGGPEPLGTDAEPVDEHRGARRYAATLRGALGASIGVVLA